MAKKENLLPDIDQEEIIKSCSEKVFRNYLPHISEEEYKPMVAPKGVRTTEQIACFEVKQFVECEDEQLIDCLETVYHVLAGSGNTVSLIVRRRVNNCIIGLAVGNPDGYSETTIKNAEKLRDSLQGNFPGTITGKIVSGIDNNLFSHIRNKGSRNSIAIVSNVATNATEDYSTQGLEKLLDGIRPRTQDEEYTLIIMGEALKPSDIDEEKKKLYRYYDDISPYASRQDSHGKTGNASFVGLAGGSLSDTTSKTYENFEVKHTIDQIEQQMERLEEAVSFGLWRFATYVISSDYSITDKVASMFLSLTQGKASFVERSAINKWLSSFKGINEIFGSLLQLRHPLFQKDNLEPVSATTIVSGIELARSLSFPQKSVSGFPVYQCARFGRNSIYSDNEETIQLGNIYHMRCVEEANVDLVRNSLTSHVFVTGSTGSGKSNTVFKLLNQVNVPFLVVEPAKGEYKDVFGGNPDVRVLGTNPKISELLRINPFEFPKEIAVCEHIDRLVELFNVCWPMYAAMPAILKDAMINAYKTAGWDIECSENSIDDKLFPTFTDLLQQISYVLDQSEYSADNKSDYTGALKTRVKSLTNGLNGLVFTADSIPDSELFDKKVIIDLSRVGSVETRSLIMGILVMKLQEYRMSDSRPSNMALTHLTVLEEAHNLLKKTSTEQSSESSNITGKSVEMITSAIAEMRSYGEGFVIVDQAPGLLDMSVIRNTNTKIIHRLPDQMDRELVGRAAGLNDQQIDELAKLECGVAAIYQNDWIEPVLGKVFEFKTEQKKALAYSNNSISDQTKVARELVKRILLNSNKLIRVDSDLVMKSNLSAQIKIMILKYASGKCRVTAYSSSLFSELYPDLKKLSVYKDANDSFLVGMKNNITKVCGDLNEWEMKRALSYYFGILTGLGKLSTQEYSDMREELNRYVSSNC